MSKFGVIGDSIAKGTDYGGVTSADTFTYIVGNRLGYAASDIVNAGISANTTVAMADRFQADIVARGVTVCGVMGMFNDIIQGISVTDYSNALRSIASQAAAARIKCVFLSPPIWRADEAGHTKNREYVYAMERVAAEVDCPFIDSYRNYAFDYLCGTSAFFNRYAPNDLMHQSKAGHQELAGVMLRGCFSKCWEPLPPAVAPTVPSEPAAVTALSIAMADYLLNCQTPALLATVQTERAKFT